MYKFVVLAFILLLYMDFFAAQNCDSQRRNIIFETLREQDVEDTVMYVIEFVDIRELCKGSIKMYPSLQTIVLNRDNISYIEPGTFDNIREIGVDLERNKLTKINNGIFNGTQISSVNLQNNEIRTIEANAFDNMPNLLTIILTDNEITVWNNEWFKNTPKLTTIIFSSNSIENLPEDAFKNLRTNKNLTLLFDGNKIKDIHERSFTGLEEVIEINLARNELKTFPLQTFSGFDTEILNLQQNILECLSEEQLANLQNVKRVKFQNNPLREDCVQTIQKHAKAAGMHVYLSDDPFSY